jgi:hypothetical protein
VDADLWPGCTVYYSMYGHVGKMAAAVKAGVDSVDGVEGVLYQVRTSTTFHDLRCFAVVGGVYSAAATQLVLGSPSGLFPVGCRHRCRTAPGACDSISP